MRLSCARHAPLLFAVRLVVVVQCCAEQIWYRWRGLRCVYQYQKGKLLRRLNLWSALERYYVAVVYIFDG